MGDGGWGDGMLGLKCYCLCVTVEGSTVRLNKKNTNANGKNKALHCKKKVCYFTVPSPGMSLTKLSLHRNNLILPVHGEFGK